MKYFRLINGANYHSGRIQGLYDKKGLQYFSMDYYLPYSIKECFAPTMSKVTKFKDKVYVSSMELVISERTLDLIKGFDLHEGVKVSEVIIDPDDKSIKGYYLVYDKDHTKRYSSIRRDDVLLGSGPKFKYVLDVEDTPAKDMFFLLSNCIVSQRLKEAIEAEGLQGFGFEELGFKD